MSILQSTVALSARHRSYSYHTDETETLPERQLARGKDVKPGSLTSELLSLNHIICCFPDINTFPKVYAGVLYTLNLQSGRMTLSLYTSLNH